VNGPKVFLSYAHVDTDKKFVARLYQRLKQDGVECFFDEASLAPGANFVLAISEAIDECNYFVMAMSQAYFAARFAPTEWAAVLADDPGNERGRLLPLRLDVCELPALLKSLNHIDVSSNEKFEQNYGRIWQHLNRTEPNDIEQRSKEIDDLIDQNRQDQAWKRLLDFARDFAKRETLNKLIAITWELERLDKENDISKRSMARVELLTEGLNVRENIINTLSLRMAQ
jgi:hypothetical protein